MILLALLVPVIIGYLSVRLFLPVRLRWNSSNLLLVSLAPGVGMGVCSCVYFVTLVMNWRQPLTLALVCIALLAANVWMARRGALSLPAVISGKPGPALTGVFLLATAIAVLTFMLSWQAEPQGQWDAWSIWNLRARMLFRGGEEWRVAFSNLLPWSHPDYPLLIPAAIALCWSLAGAESIEVPAAVAFLFTFGALGVLVATIRIVRGGSSAMLAGILLASTPAWLRLGASEYADVPLAFFIVSTLALFALQDRFPASVRYSALAGATAGLAAWTKNEGLLFVGAVALARLLAVAFFGRSNPSLRQLPAFAAGLAPVLAVVIYFKLAYAGPSDLLGAKPRLTDISRYLGAFYAFVKEAFAIGNFVIPVIVALAAYWYFARFRWDQRERPALATLAITLCLMIAGYYAVYVALTKDLQWQLDSSLQRLSMHLWPAMALLFFMAVGAPAGPPIEPEKARKRNTRGPRK
jgi:hypothetical protein